MTEEKKVDIATVIAAETTTTEDEKVETVEQIVARCNIVIDLAKVYREISPLFEGTSVSIKICGPDCLRVYLPEGIAIYCAFYSVYGDKFYRANVEKNHKIITRPRERYERKTLEQVVWYITEQAKQYMSF